MALTIDNLQIQIDTKAQSATDGINALQTSLTNLRDSIGDTSGLVNTLTQLSTAMKGLSSAKSLAKGLTELDTAASVLKTDRLTEFSSQMKGIADGLSQLNTIEKGNLGSVLNQLKNIPKIAEELKPDVIEKFSVSIRRLVEVLEPLASQMDKIGRGFGMLPGRMKSTIRASQQVVNGNKTMYKSYNSLGTHLARTAARFWTLFYSMQRLVNIFADAFNKSNEYIESLNLFRVSMGDAGDTAMEFAEKVSSLMGIDIAEWITNQGSFMRMSTGFGIASDKAELMSKNLTQLAYDMSSFFNVDVQTAMDKLQSGMSGQIKGLKEWGYNLSVASLQETALRHGIEQSVRTMTEAQKAQLRYITLIDRSLGVMGDMGKTIETPANALRVLSAQIDRLQRAFGNLVSLFVTKFIPYLMAGTELLEEAVASWAEAWGFEIPELPENNLEMGAEVIEGIGDEADETSNKLAEMKRQIMGFDELNILKSDKDKSSELPSYDLGIDLPDYDFLANLNTEYRDRIDEIKEGFQKFGDTLKQLTPVIVSVIGLLAFEKIASAIAKLKTFRAALKGVSVVLGGLLKPLSNMWQTFLVTGDAVQALRVGWEKFLAPLKNLSPFAKVLTSIVALGAELLVVKDAVHDFTAGTSTCGEMLLKIIPITALVGTAMYAMLGPWGLVATAVAGVAGAVWGFIDAQNEAVEQLMNTSITETFYDGIGTKISDIATAFDTWTTKIKNSKTEIITMGSEVGSAKDNVQKVTDSITNLAGQVELGLKTIEETVPKITAEFATLYDDTKTILLNEAELIYAALAGSTGEALKDLGFNLDAYKDMIGEAVGSANEDLKALKDSADELMDAMNRDTAEFEEMGGMTALLDITQQIAELSGLQANPLEDFLASMDGINWESPEAMSEAFNKISTSATEAQNAIETAYQGTIDSMKHYKSLTDDKDAIAMWDNMLSATVTARENELAEIKAAKQKVLDAFQADLIWKLTNQIAAAKEEWNTLNRFQQEILYRGDEDLFIKKFLTKYQDGEFKTIMEDMVAKFGKEAAWANDAMDDILENLFSGTRYGPKAMADVTDTINSFLPEEFKKRGEEVVAGLANGLANNGMAKKGMKDVAQILKDTFDSEMDIHSPSFEMEKRGLFTIEGLANGISNNAYLVVNSFDSMFVTIEERFLKFATNCKTAMTELTTSLSGKYTTDASLTSKFDTSMIGNKTAVSADGNLVQGIASAVYRAMISAHEDTADSGVESKVIVAIDGDKVGETSVRYINGRIVQTGASPIYTF